MGPMYGTIYLPAFAIINHNHVNEVKYAIHGSCGQCLLSQIHCLYQNLRFRRKGFGSTRRDWRQERGNVGAFRPPRFEKSHLNKTIKQQKPQQEISQLRKSWWPFLRPARHSIRGNLQVIVGGHKLHKNEICCRFQLKNHPSTKDIPPLVNSKIHPHQKKEKTQFEKISPQEQLIFLEVQDRKSSWSLGWSIFRITYCRWAKFGIRKACACHVSLHSLFCRILATVGQGMAFLVEPEGNRTWLSFVLFQAQEGLQKKLQDTVTALGGALSGGILNSSLQLIWAMGIRYKLDQVRSSSSILPWFFH